MQKLICKNNKLSFLADKVFKTITEAKKITMLRYVLFMLLQAHTKLCIESLNLEMHTLAVKSIATNPKEFKELIKTHKKSRITISQGLNNQWNEAASKMIGLVKNQELMGKMFGGQCIWGRQI